MSSSSSGLLDYLADIPDPRIERCQAHRLLDILMIAVCGAICGADNWVAIAEFGRAKADWLKSLTASPRRYVRSRPYFDCFTAWVQSLTPQLADQQAVARDCLQAKRRNSGSSRSVRRRSGHLRREDQALRITRPDRCSCPVAGLTPVRYGRSHQTNYRYHGIYYKFSLKFSLHAFLFVEVEDSIYFGVKCPKEENKDEYNRLKEALEEVPGRSYKSYLWYQYVSDLNLNVPDLNLKYPTREHLKRLVNEDERQKYVKAVVSGVGDVWKRIKGDGLA